MVGDSGGTQGHAFISYVREDAARVDRLQAVLESAGIQVWRDTEDLWGGEDWRVKIRNAISDGALAFIACFSTHSAARETSYQNEELLLAVEQLRLRPPDRAWLIPVRFDECAIPDLEIGGGRLLSHLQRVDLFDDNWDVGIAKLVASVLRILQRHDAGVSLPTAEVGGVTDQMKRLLLDPSKQIELEGLVMGLCNEVHDHFADENVFPGSSDQLTNDVAGHRYLAAQADKYWELVTPVVDALIVGSAWGLPAHNGLWTRAMTRVVNVGFPDRAQDALVSLRRLPLLVLLYGAGLAAVDRQRYDCLKAVAIDAEYRARYGERMPVVAAAHPWRSFERGEIAANILALEARGEVVTDGVVDELLSGRRGKRHTPISDLLHDRLRPRLQELIPDDEDYTATFDRLEVLLPLLAADIEAQNLPGGVYIDGPWFGSFTWRDRYHRDSIESRIAAEFTGQQADWPPLVAGLLGGSTERTEAAFEVIVQGAAEARRNRH